MRFLFRLPFDLIIWTAFSLVSTVLDAVGLAILIRPTRRKAWHLRASRFYKDREVTVWDNPKLWLWGNEEDGVTGPVWWKDGAYKWSAIRNPTNNLRFVKYLGFKLVPEKIRYVGNSDNPWGDLLDSDITGRKFFWSYTDHGFYAGFWVIIRLSNKRHFRFRLGWKIYPQDKLGLSPTDYRNPAIGFARQFTPYREW